jgi:hypothetical protein
MKRINVLRGFLRRFFEYFLKNLQRPHFPFIFFLKIIFVCKFFNFLHRVYKHMDFNHEQLSSKEVLLFLNEIFSCLRRCSRSYLASQPPSPCNFNGIEETWKTFSFDFHLISWNETFLSRLKGFKCSLFIFPL